jgi:peptidoglycan-N-acetylglucosamine deacetylase
MLRAVIGAAAAAAALSASGYQSMAPTGQWYGRTFIGGKRGSKQLALTFDDGPNDPHTLRLLEVLAKNDVRATFFLIGRYVEQRPDIVRAIAAAGHVVGNHTYTHPNLIFCSALQVRTQIAECERALTQAVGEHSRLFRPPFGGRRPASLRVAREMGLEPIMWNVAGLDWKGESAEYVERRVAKHIQGGDVILLHDGGHTGMGADRAPTVLATERLITRYKGDGFEFVTVPEMMGKPVSHRLSASK